MFFSIPFRLTSFTFEVVDQFFESISSIIKRIDDFCFFSDLPSAFVTNSRGVEGKIFVVDFYISLN